MKKLFRKITAITVLGALCLSIVGCSSNNNPAQQDAQTDVDTQIQVEVKERPPVNLGVLKGPTGMGAAKLMDDDAQEVTVNDYVFTIASSPDEITAKIISGEIDIASVPTNLASVLYNKTEGEVTMVAVNTLGVLHLVHDGSVEINSLEDLRGKTVYATGQGSTPEYVIDFILKQNGIDDVTVEYMQEHAELTTALASGTVSIGILPEPNVTTALSKNSELVKSLDLTQVWNETVAGGDYDGSVLSMGSVIVRNEFLQNNTQVVDDFLQEYSQSIKFVNENPAQGADIIEQYGIVPSAEIAKNAIPNSNMVYIDGTQMQDSISRFLEVLFEANPKAVGGSLPDEKFYYTK